MANLLTWLKLKNVNFLLINTVHKYSLNYLSKGYTIVRDQWQLAGLLVWVKVANIEVNKLGFRLQIDKKWLTDGLEFMMWLDGHLATLVCNFIQRNKVLKRSLLLLALTLKTKKLNLQPCLWIVREAAMWFNPVKTGLNFLQPLIVLR
jgi:hypothetical protein